MKKTVIALLTATTLSSSAFAAVSDANFQWGGLVPPAESIVPEVCIKNTGIVDHKSGVLEFTNDGAQIDLVGASDLSFKVMNNCDATGTDIAYKYTLKNTAVSIGGVTNTDITSDLQQWLKVTANTDVLVHDDQSAEIAAGKSTVLSVAQTKSLVKDDEAELYADLDAQDVLVTAIVEVTNEI